MSAAKDRLQALYEAATPGTWSLSCFVDTPLIPSPQDAEFICGAHTFVPVVLADLGAREAQISKLVEAGDELRRRLQAYMGHNDDVREVAFDDMACAAWTAAKRSTL